MNWLSNASLEISLQNGARGYIYILTGQLSPKWKYNTFNSNSWYNLQNYPTLLLCTTVPNPPKQEMCMKWRRIICTLSTQIKYVTHHYSKTIQTFKILFLQYLNFLSLHIHTYNHIKYHTPSYTQQEDATNQIIPFGVYKRTYVDIPNYRLALGCMDLGRNEDHRLLT
jgi:hypothetical protein